jgi:hypothetical protein
VDLGDGQERRQNRQVGLSRYNSCTVRSMTFGSAPCRTSRATRSMASGGGKGSASSSYADTATLPLIHRKSWSTVGVFRKAASAAAGSKGVPLTGRIMLRWFSTTTPPWCSTKDAGNSAAMRRRDCSFAVVRCNKTHGEPRDYPTLLWSRLKVWLVITPLGAKLEHSIGPYRFSPDKRISTFGRNIAQARFVAIPYQRSRADLIPVIQQPLRHSFACTDQFAVAVRARDQPRSVRL